MKAADPGAAQSTGLASERLLPRADVNQAMALHAADNPPLCLSG